MQLDRQSSALNQYGRRYGGTTRWGDIAIGRESESERVLRASRSGSPAPAARLLAPCPCAGTASLRHKRFARTSRQEQGAKDPQDDETMSRQPGSVLSGQTKRSPSFGTAWQARHGHGDDL